MTRVIAPCFALSCVLSLNAQITAFLKPLPDGSNEVRIRNDAAISLEAFAVRANGSNVVEFERSKRPNRSDAPSTVYADSMIDEAPARLAPREERVVEEGGVLWF